MTSLAAVTADQIRWVLDNQERVRDDFPHLLPILEWCMHPYIAWRPRPDQPTEYDEQASALNSTARVTVILGGTGSGKTSCAACKTARYLLSKPAPREKCPFWVVGESYESVCEVCWLEKLRNFIPERAIRKVVWMDSAREWPRAVILKDLHKTGTNWVIQFKSYEQGRKKFQAASIGGWWCNEETPMSIIEEIFGRCREYDSPGWADFTPLEVKSPDWPRVYEKWSQGAAEYSHWAFYHLNTELNTALAPGWAQRFLSTIPEDMRETRRIGTFSSFRGAVFKEFRRNLHVIDPFDIPDDWRRFRGIDFGFRNPTAVVWVARDPDGRYYVYDEHYKAEQTIQFHADSIKAKRWIDFPGWMRQLYGDHHAQERHEYLQHGLHIKPARKEIMAGIEAIRRRLMVDGSGNPALFVFNTCEKLVEEIAGYRWPDGSKTRNPSDLPMDKDNHAIDALRYVIASEEFGTTGNDPEIVTPVRKREWQEQSKRFF